MLSLAGHGAAEYPAQTYPHLLLLLPLVSVDVSSDSCGSFVLLDSCTLLLKYSIMKLDAESASASVLLDTGTSPQEGALSVYSVPMSN